MNTKAAQSYLRTKVLTATPEQLQLMLYDGAIRFAEQAKLAIQQKNFQQSYTLLTKVQNIVTQMVASLRHDVYPELCGKLASLYTYALRQVIKASTSRKVGPLEEAIDVLKYQRETWALLLEKLGKDKAGAAAQSLDIPEPSSRMEASISMQG